MHLNTTLAYGDALCEDMAAQTFYRNRGKQERNQNDYECDEWNAVEYNVSGTGYRK